MHFYLQALCDLPVHPSAVHSIGENHEHGTQMQIGIQSSGFTKKIRSIYNYVLYYIVYY